MAQNRVILLLLLLIPASASAESCAKRVSQALKKPAQGEASAELAALGWKFANQAERETKFRKPRPAQRISAGIYRASYPGLKIVFSEQGELLAFRRGQKNWCSELWD